MPAITMSKKPDKVKNWITGTEYDETLQSSALPGRCSRDRCVGSIMGTQPDRKQAAPKTKEEVLTQAKEFIDEYFASFQPPNKSAHQKRWSETSSAIEAKGTYDLTTEELTFGAKLAWRNASRCIGRIQWSKLQLFDARDVNTAQGIFDAMCKHITYATNKGNLRSTITVFRPRQDGLPDHRIWNAQVIRYAGYKMDDGSIVGDPAGVEFTEVCMNLGWKPKYGRFDVLPLVISVAGADPVVFDIPQDLVMEVDIAHPTNKKLAELDLKWFALPAIANMALDVGGIEFPASPFNGWYMGTEIGSRDFCDVARYNLLEPIAEKLGLDTMSNSSLWKDRALVEINVAVLHSFQSKGVTITDHHSASESFMTHLQKERKARGGCPGDWVWLVPPMSSSITEVFHQELLLYKLRPSYEYQTPAWLTHVWEKDRGMVKKKRIPFKTLSKAVMFSSHLWSRALARRVKCTILFASETGRSESFADNLLDMIKPYFNAKVVCMEDYKVSDLCGESLLLVVTSTFGNGDPPVNGETFDKDLKEMIKNSLPLIESGQSGKNKSVKKSQVSPMNGKGTDANNNNNDINNNNNNNRNNKNNNTNGLGNMKYSVFALGSKAYPHFAEFGKTVDRCLSDLGATRVHKVGEGDELHGQEHSFDTWAGAVVEAACKSYNIVPDKESKYKKETSRKAVQAWTPETYRLVPQSQTSNPDLCTALSDIHNRKVVSCGLKERTQLQGQDSDRQTILVELDTGGKPELTYAPGDHVAIFPENDPDLVDGILQRLVDNPPYNSVVALETCDMSAREENRESWSPVTRFPACSIRMALTSFLDVTTPPTQSLLKIYATQAKDASHKKKLEELATNPDKYEQWRSDKLPDLLHVLSEFPSIQLTSSLVLAQLPVLRQRYYSISSSPSMYPGAIHATVAVLEYRMSDDGPLHKGVCSTWLNRCALGTGLPCTVRPAPSFHLPTDPSLPVVMVGPGTGIASFRSFWQQRMHDRQNMTSQQRDKLGPMVLYFGCRQSDKDDIYGKETQKLKIENVLQDVHTAFSREPGQKKMYVQDMLRENAPEVLDLIVKQSGHFYVCGDVTMADDVKKSLEQILQDKGDMSRAEAETFMQELRSSGRYHEDIFGTGFKTPASRGKEETRPETSMQRRRDDVDDKLDGKICPSKTCSIS
ncbi:nitric oxide synthase 2 [Aplysia californica]|uniref:Nitric oxide synthase n=1 Tax=Aplysia californica TaxID=6500 RepID=Q7YWK8_APLCA|nr:nitric oxide synthase 2 [Aplysia californica]AAK92211.3 nitric oxide synthase 2 [Aplysia californica]